MTVKATLSACRGAIRELYVKNVLSMVSRLTLSAHSRHMGGHGTDNAKLL